MIDFVHAPAQNNDEMRQQIYAGTILILPSTSASRQLVDDVTELVQERLGKELRHSQHRFTYDEFFAHISALKKTVYEEPRFRSAVADVIGSLGFNLGAVACDPARLRAVQSDGHNVAGAKASYSAHRDTWYANPQAQINCWIPLHPVTRAETFTFYPECFKRALENTSSTFDYAQWSKTVGFGRSHAANDAAYPTCPADQLLKVTPLAVACDRAEILLFSAAHLHQTSENSTGMTRFSLDFRIVHLGDLRSGCGAPNVDNHSTGSALSDYVGDLAAI